MPEDFLVNPAVRPEQVHTLVCARSYTPFPWWATALLWLLPADAGYWATVAHAIAHPHSPAPWYTALLPVVIGLSGGGLCAAAAVPRQLLDLHRARRAAALRAEYGANLTIDAAAVDSGNGALLLRGLCAAVEAAQALEELPERTGYAPGQVLRAVRSQAWQAGLLAREAAALTEAAQDAAPAVRAEARVTVAELYAGATTRLAELVDFVKDARRGAPGGALGALSRARATLSASATHQPLADLTGDPAGRDELAGLDRATVRTLTS